MENPEERELVLPIWKTWSLKKQTRWLWNDYGNKATEKN
jgi:hypothetical protein